MIRGMQVIEEDKNIQIAYVTRYTKFFIEGRMKEPIDIPDYTSEVLGHMVSRCTFIFKDHWFFYLNKWPVGDSKKFNITCGITGYSVMEAPTNDPEICKVILRDYFEIREGMYFQEYLKKCDSTLSRRGISGISAAVKTSLRR